MEAKAIQRTVVCESGTITYFLTRKSVKNINLRVKLDGRVLVSANHRVPTAYIDGFIRQKQAYILSALTEFEEKRKRMQEEPKRYVTGESCTLLGRVFRLTVEEAEEETVYIDGDSIFLKVKDGTDFRHKEIMMTRWLKEYRMAVFKRLVDAAYERFRAYHVPYPELRVRSMTSRWGSCHPVKGVITLNSRLIEAPESCIEYVVLHEFAHFIHPDHSRRFWDLVTMLMPDWRERKNRLENREGEKNGAGY